MAMRPHAPDRMTDTPAGARGAVAAAPAAIPPVVAGSAETQDAFAAHAAAHGGRLSAAMTAYPNAPTPWLDLSTGINPEPWPGARAPADLLARLPDPVQLAGLEAAAARAFGMADPARVVATGGAEAGLRLLPRVIHAADVDIVSPTYSGHESAWRTGATRVHRIGAEHMRASAACVLALVNPNNPDGRALGREPLSDLIARRTAARLWTIVDESFVETEPGLSVADLASDRLVVLRSFGKFYGLPGLRLGFAIAPPGIAERLRTLQGEWPVSSEAIVMGSGAYADRTWRTHAEARLRLQAEALDDLLVRRGLTVLGGTSLFRLVSVSGARRVFDGLCRAGILTRPFTGPADWLRFGLPPQQDLGRLDDALRQAMR
ncbi:threonine-phosphate decarboxylase CobD [Phenylobacterium sp. SCN 70-31]|uniref:threonine-phosphate decarboxylase CobD n=1 Tax=Phenylobacterium sp. SCN 70-31 TaxID=1660129 RepID=UPI0025E84761|nr:threonine-phosphate decarboxylase CobD [Phenylobacterium sp. SCN 70-31]